jgi:flagellar motor switch protein FliG
LSELVDFSELGELDGADLRAVLEQVPRADLLVALAGAPAGLRTLLLTNLPSAAAAALTAELDALETVPIEAVRTAQRALVEAMCRLSRAGQVAFDDPDDMVA